MGASRIVVLLVVLAAGLGGCAGEPSAPTSDATGDAPGATSGVAGCASVNPGTDPRPAADPPGLACQINAGEAATRDPASAPERASAGGRLAQVAYRVVGDRPELDAAVLPAVTPELREHATRALAAHREFAALAGPPQPNLPAWKIVEPLPTGELRGLYQQAQDRFGVPWQVLAAIHLVETRMGRIIGLSSAGAQGPMQFIPETWARYGLGGTITDTRDAIMGAANYLAANGAARSGPALDRALYRYNNDVRYVRGVRLYADMMTADERAYLGLHGWAVEYRTVAGDIPLLPGYLEPRPVPAREWLARPPR